MDLAGSHCGGCQLQGSGTGGKQAPPQELFGRSLAAIRSSASSTGANIGGRFSRGEARPGSIKCLHLCLISGSLRPASKEGIPSSKGEPGGDVGVKRHGVPFGGLQLSAGADEEANPHRADVLVREDLEALIPVEESSFR